MPFTLCWICATRDDLGLSILQLHTRWPIRPSGCRVGARICGEPPLVTNLMRSVEPSLRRCVPSATYGVGFNLSADDAMLPSPIARSRRGVGPLRGPSAQRGFWPDPDA